MDKEIPKGKGRLISIKGNVRVREMEGQFDGALARVVISWFDWEVEKKSRESEKNNERGRIACCPARLGDVIYTAQGSTRRQVCYETSER